MPSETLVRRMEFLEARMTRLEELPARIDDLVLQVSQFRGEMHAGFLAIEAQVHRDAESLYERLHEEACRTLREEIQAGDEETRRTLREEIRTGDEETRRQMRVLHEDVIARLAMLQEGLGSRGGARSKKGRPH